MYKKVVNPISWDQNPKSAMENYNRMVDFFKKTVSKTVAKSTNEIRSDLRNDKSAESEGILDLVYNPQTGKLENAK
jgi:Iap family predicted aminopeptidase